jgi:hypothetical protein
MPRFFLGLRAGERQIRPLLFLGRSIHEPDPCEQREGVHGENGSQDAGNDDVVHYPLRPRRVENHAGARLGNEEKKVAGGGDGVEENRQMPVTSGQWLRVGRPATQIERE